MAGQEISPQSEGSSGHGAPRLLGCPKCGDLQGRRARSRRHFFLTFCLLPFLISVTVTC
jgi:hypothetical protein